MHKAKSFLFPIGLMLLLQLGAIGELSLTHRAAAQDWVKAMFESNSHDFGTVPRGAKAEFSFKLTNKYEETVRIQSVRSSCGCTIPRIEKSDLKTYEEGAIICEFNTRSFVGPKAAVVTVVFAQPFYGEMQLNVKGNIRSDIVTEPGKIEFGEVSQGESKQTELRISYAGRNDWKIVDVRSANNNLSVGKLESDNRNGRVSYVMSVSLKDSAPAGEFSDQIVLVTNENEFNLVTVPVRGVVLPPVVMPVSIELGSIRVGDVTSSRLVIKGKEDFSITDIECADSRFSFQIPEGPKRAHIIPLQFKAGDKVGAVRQPVVVKTSLSNGETATTVITANVVD